MEEAERNQLSSLLGKLELESRSRLQQEAINSKLMTEQDLLRKKLAEAELHIDQLRLGANVDINKRFILSHETRQCTTLQQRLEAQGISNHIGGSGSSTPHASVFPTAEEERKKRDHVTSADGKSDCRRDHMTREEASEEVGDTFHWPPGKNGSRMVSGGVPNCTQDEDKECLQVSPILDLTLQTPKTYEEHLQILSSPSSKGEPHAITDTFETHRTSTPYENKFSEKSHLDKEDLFFSSITPPDQYSHDTSISGEYDDSAMLLPLLHEKDHLSSNLDEQVSVEGHLLTQLFRIHSLLEQISSLKHKAGQNGCTLEELSDDLGCVLLEYEKLVMDIGQSGQGVAAMERKYSDHVSEGSREALEDGLVALAKDLKELDDMLRRRATLSTDTKQEQQQHNTTEKDMEEQSNFWTQKPQEISSHDTSHFPSSNISNNSGGLSKYLPEEDSNSTNTSSEMGIESNSILLLDLEELSLTEIGDDDGHDEYHQRTGGRAINRSQTKRINPLQLCPSQDVRQSGEKTQQMKSSSSVLTQSHSLSFPEGTKQNREEESGSSRGHGQSREKQSRKESGENHQGGNWHVGRGGGGGVRGQQREPEQSDICGEQRDHGQGGGGKVRQNPRFRSRIPRPVKGRKSQQPLWQSHSYSTRTERSNDIPVLPSTRSEGDKSFVLPSHSRKYSPQTSHHSKLAFPASHTFSKPSISFSSRLRTPPSHSNKLSTPKTGLDLGDEELHKEQNRSSYFSTRVDNHKESDEVRALLVTQQLSPPTNHSQEDLNPNRQRPHVSLLSVGQDYQDAAETLSPQRREGEDKVRCYSCSANLTSHIQSSGDTGNQREDKDSLRAPRHHHHISPGETCRDDETSHSRRSNVSAESQGSSSQMSRHSFNNSQLNPGNQDRDNDSSDTDNLTSDGSHSGVNVSECDSGRELSPEKHDRKSHHVNSSSDDHSQVADSLSRNHSGGVCPISVATGVVTPQLSPVYLGKESLAAHQAEVTDLSVVQQRSGDLLENVQVPQINACKNDPALLTNNSDVTICPSLGSYSTKSLMESLETPHCSSGSHQSVDCQTSTSLSCISSTTQCEDRNHADVLVRNQCRDGQVSVPNPRNKINPQRLAFEKHAAVLASCTGSSFGKDDHSQKLSHGAFVPQLSGLITRAYMDSLRKDLERLKQQVMRTSQPYSSQRTNHSRRMPQHHTVSCFSSTSSDPALSSAGDFQSSTVANPLFSAQASTTPTLASTTSSISGTVGGSSAPQFPQSSSQGTSLAKMHSLIPSEDFLEESSHPVHTPSLSNSLSQVTSPITSCSSKPPSLMNSTQHSSSTVDGVRQTSNQFGTPVRSPSHTSSIHTVTNVGGGGGGGTNLTYSMRPLSDSPGSTPLRTPQQSNSQPLLGASSSAFSLSYIESQWPPGSRSQPALSLDGQNQPYWPSDSNQSSSSGPHSQPAWSSGSQVQPYWSSECSNKPPSLARSRSQPVWSTDGHSQPSWPLEDLTLHQLPWVSTPTLTEDSLPPPIPRKSALPLQNEDNIQNPLSSTPISDKNSPLWSRKSSSADHVTLTPPSNTQFSSGGNTPLQSYDNTFPLPVNITKLSTPLSNTAALSEGNTPSWMKSDTAPSLEYFSTPLSSTSEGNTPIRSRSSNNTALSMGYFASVSTPVSSNLVLSEGSTPSWTKQNSAPSLDNLFNLSSLQNSTPSLSRGSAPSWSNRISLSERGSHGSVPDYVFSPVLGNIPSWPEGTDTNLASLEDFQYSSLSAFEADSNVGSVTLEHPFSELSEEPCTTRYDEIDGLCSPHSLVHDSTVRLEDSGVGNTSCSRYSSPTPTGRVEGEVDNINKRLQSTESPEDGYHHTHITSGHSKEEESVHGNKRYSLVSETNSTEASSRVSHRGRSRRRRSAHRSTNSSSSEIDGLRSHYYDGSNSNNSENDSGGFRFTSKERKRDSHSIGTGSRQKARQRDHSSQLSGPGGASGGERGRHYEHIASPSHSTAHSDLLRVASSHDFPLQLSHNHSTNHSGQTSSRPSTSHHHDHNYSHFSSRQRSPLRSPHTHSSNSPTKQTSCHPKSGHRSPTRPSHFGIPSKHTSSHTNSRHGSLMQYSHLDTPTKNTSSQFSANHKSPVQHPQPGNFLGHTLDSLSSHHRSPSHSSNPAGHHTFSHLSGSLMPSSYSSKPPEHTYTGQASSHRPIIRSHQSNSSSSHQPSASGYSSGHYFSDQSSSHPCHASSSSQVVSSSSTPLWMPQAKPSSSSSSSHFSTNHNTFQDYSPSHGQTAPELNASRHRKEEYREKYADNRRHSDTTVTRPLAGSSLGEYRHSRQSILSPKFKMENTVDYSSGNAPTMVTIGTKFSPSTLTDIHHSSITRTSPLNSSHGSHLHNPRSAKSKTPSLQQLYRLKAIYHITNPEDSMSSTDTAYGTAQLNSSSQRHGTSPSPLSHSSRHRHSPGFVRGGADARMDEARTLVSPYGRDPLLVVNINKKVRERARRSRVDDNQLDREIERTQTLGAGGEVDLGPSMEMAAKVKKRSERMQDTMMRDLKKYSLYTQLPPPPNTPHNRHYDYN